MATLAASWMPSAHQRAATAPHTTNAVASTHDYHYYQQHQQNQYSAHSRQSTTPAATTSTASSSSSRRPSKSNAHPSNSSNSTSHHTQTTAASSSNSPTTSSSSQHSDRFYGHRELAELCERVILALFSCPLDSTASSVDATSSPTIKAAPRLAEFVAYALHRTRLPLAVTHQALFLLKRLKSRFPAARGSSGHRLFISALMLASKSSCDDTYSNKSWTIVGQGLFSLREVNQMERELFGYLGFRVNVEPEELDEFVYGLQQGRIHAPTEPVSPAMNLNYGFESTAMETSTSSSSSSPSVASEPGFTGRDYAGPAGYPSRSRPAINAFNTRASFSGYPSIHSSSSPSTAATSSSSSNMEVSSSSQGRSTSASRYNQTRLTAAPAVPMQGQYYPSPSVASLASSHACARGNSTSSSSDGSTSYVPSPFGSQVSSGSTTPESPTCQLDSPPDCDWTQAAIVDDDVDSTVHHHHHQQQHHDVYSKQRMHYPSSTTTTTTRQAHHYYRS